MLSGMKSVFQKWFLRAADQVIDPDIAGCAPVNLRNKNAE